MYINLIKWTVKCSFLVLDKIFIREWSCSLWTVRRLHILMFYLILIPIIDGIKPNFSRSCWVSTPIKPLIAKRTHLVFHQKESGPKAMPTRACTQTKWIWCISKHIHCIKNLKKLFIHDIYSIVPIQEIISMKIGLVPFNKPKNNRIQRSRCKELPCWTVKHFHIY